MWSCDQKHYSLIHGTSCRRTVSSLLLAVLPWQRQCGIPDPIAPFLMGSMRWPGISPLRHRAHMASLRIAVIFWNFLLRRIYLNQFKYKAKEKTDSKNSSCSELEFLFFSSRVQLVWNFFFFGIASLPFRKIQPFSITELLIEFVSYSHTQLQYLKANFYLWFISQCWILFEYHQVW